jgi:hypothetical protein
VQFTEHCAKQGPLAQTIRKYKDEEQLSKLGNTLEAAFRRFQVNFTPHKPFTTLSRDRRQFESHIRTEKSLHTVLTTDKAILTATNTILTSTNTILPAASTILTTTNTILTTTNTIRPTANTMLKTTRTLVADAETGAL